jgi:hypothetical protein
MVFAPLTALPGQVSQPCFSINLSTPESVVKSGYEVRAKVTLRIIRTCSFAEGKRTAELDYTVDVRDSNGNPPPESNYSKVIKGTYTGRPREVSVSTGDPLAFMVEPGQTFTEDLDLDNLYDLSQLGSYTVQLSRFDDESKTWVKSNTVAITVVPTGMAQPPPPTGQNPTLSAPFSVTIWLRRSSYDPFVLDIITKNTSDHPITFQPARDEKDLLGSVYKVDVVDSSGNPPPETDFGRSIGNGNQSPPSSPPPAPPPWPGYRNSLNPGEEWRDTILLSWLYNLITPSENTIQVRRWDNETKTWVKSNRITRHR